MPTGPPKSQSKKPTTGRCRTRSRRLGLRRSIRRSASAADARPLATASSVGKKISQAAVPHVSGNNLRRACDGLGGLGGQPALAEAATTSGPSFSNVCEAPAFVLCDWESGQPRRSSRAFCVSTATCAAAACAVSRTAFAVVLNTSSIKMAASAAWAAASRAAAEVARAAAAAYRAVPSPSLLRRQR